MRTIQEFMLRALSGVLLLLVLVSSIPLTFLHEHDSEEVACEIRHDEVAEDPCHLTVYHGKLNEQGCVHPTHLHKKTLPCKLCEFWTSHHLFEPVPPTVAFQSVDNTPGQTPFPEGEYTQCQAPANTRGPPTC